MNSAKTLPPLVLGAYRRRHPLDAVIDRPRNEAALALAAAWLAFGGGLLIGGEIVDVASFLISAALATALVWLGFAAASRTRPLPINAHPARLALLALAIGAVLGAANLAANAGIAAADPQLRALLSERFVEIPVLKAVVAAPLVEEVAMRLFLLSALTWVVFRLTKRRGLAFALALTGSSLFFAAMHLDRPMPADAGVAAFYQAALMAKYTLAALPLGLLFWRWGLPYAILCHAAANAAHSVLQQGIF